MRTVEQYEFHIWRFFCFLEPKLREEVSSHKDLWLDIVEEKRMENRTQRKMLMSKYTFCVEDIKKDDIDEFRLNLSKENLAIKSINAHIITFRSWFKYLKKEGINCIDPTSLDLIRPGEREVTFLTNEEIERFFESIDQESLR